MSAAPVDLLIVGVTLLAPALGGSTLLWAQALVVLGSMALIWWSPPRQWLPRPLALLLVALVVLGATGFLPASWFALPAWRKTLLADYRLALPGTLSPQPWVTLEHLLLLAAGVVWSSYLLSRRWETPRRVLLSVYCAGLLVLVLAALVVSLGGVQLSLWGGGIARFGFCPAKNRTGNVIALGAVAMLALGFEAFERRSKAGFLWLLGYAVSLAALVLDYSRAGIVFFFAGSLAWVLWTAGRARRLAVGLTVVLPSLSLFLLLGGDTLDRFIHPQEQAATCRWNIQSDAWRLFKEVSWHGVGLGNFDPVFARYRVASATELRVIHPEGDWWWAGIELGWAAPWLVLGAVAYWLRRHWPRRSCPNFRLLAALAVGGLLFLVHGVVDVSGHCLGTVWPVLFLVSLLRGPAAATERSLWAPRVYRGLAAALGVVAIGWLASVSATRALPTSATLAALRSEMVSAQSSHRYADTICLANQALRYAPLDWELYFWRALGEARSQPGIDAALVDFGRACFLEPGFSAVPFEEGMVWLWREPSLAVSAWQEALRRRTSDRAGLYRQMLDAAAGLPEIRDDVRALALDQPELLLVFLAQATDEEVAVEVDRLVREDPALKSFTKDQQKTFFAIWAGHSDKDTLLKEMDSHPDWLAAGWMACARVLAEQAKFKEACELARRWATVPSLPALATQVPLAQLQRNLLLAPDDFVSGYALYQAQIDAQETEDALLTLRKLTVRARCPKYFYYLQATLEMERDSWREAWQAWEIYVQG